jgi:hypothetical protein
MLSAVLVVTTVFPSVNVTLLLLALSAALAVGGLGFAAIWLRARTRVTAPREEQPIKRETWTMPPLALLGKPEWSRGRIIAIYTMWGYLLITVSLLIVKAIKLAGG